MKFFFIISNLLLFVSLSQAEFDFKSCNNDRIKEIVSDLNSAGIILKPHHTEGVAEECIQKCTEAEYARIASEVASIDEVLQPHHTEGVEEECRLNSCMSAAVSEVNEANLILKPHHTEHCFGSSSEETAGFGVIN